MRSTGQLILHQRIPNMVTYGERSFACGGPRLWNNLDPNLRKIVSPQTFKRKLNHIYIKLYTHVKYVLLMFLCFLMSLFEGKFVSKHFFFLIFVFNF